MARTTEVRVPDIGDFSDVPVIEVLVHAGDRVREEDPLITLESDKASMDVPSPGTGVVRELKVSVGDKLSEGSPILTLELEDGAGAGERTGSAGTPEQTAGESAGESAGQPAQGPPAAREREAPAAEDGGAGSEEVRVPDIGDFTDVPVIEVMVKAGDRVAAEDPLVTLESDKASMDVPSPRAGVVREVKVSVGDKVSEGSPILILETREGGAAQPAAQAQEEKAAPAAAREPQPHEAAAGGKPVQPPAAEDMPPEAAPGAAPGRPAPTAPLRGQEAGAGTRFHATPAVRRFARELGADLAAVRGTGRKGRILREDVKRYIKTRLTTPSPAGGTGLPEMPEIDFSKFGEVETRPLSRIKKLGATSLHRSWLIVPHVTQHDEADITELEAFRKSQGEEAKKRNVRLTLLAFLMKASVAALKAHPGFNASLDPRGENLILKHYYHLGIAVDTADGLVVPVVRDVDGKGIYELAGELAEVSARARERKLSPGDMQGASFTISSLGGVGGTAFTPIVNAPEVAILGVSRSQMKPVYRDGGFVPRLMLPLSLSYDHRVIDGAAAARFTTFLAEVLADIRKLLL